MHVHTYELHVSHCMWGLRYTTIEQDSQDPPNKAEKGFCCSNWKVIGEKRITTKRELGAQLD